MIKIIFFALGIIVLDQAVKLWVLASFALGEARPFIPGVLQLRYVQNTGMAFGLLAEHQWIFLIFNPLILIAVTAFVVKTKIFTGKAQQFAFAAFVAGGFSNWIDRIAHGFVVDMFEPTFMRFAVFNVADIFIILGAIVLFVAYALSETRKHRIKGV